MLTRFYIKWTLRHSCEQIDGDSKEKNEKDFKTAEHFLRFNEWKIKKEKEKKKRTSALSALDVATVDFRCENLCILIKEAEGDKWRERVGDTRQRRRASDTDKPPTLS